MPWSRAVVRTEEPSKQADSNTMVVVSSIIPVSYTHLDVYKRQPDDTAQTLQKRVMEEAEWKLLPQAVSLFCQGKLEIEQDFVKINE